MITGSGVMERNAATGQQSCNKIYMDNQDQIDIGIQVKSGKTRNVRTQNKVTGQQSTINISQGAVQIYETPLPQSQPSQDPLNNLNTPYRSMNTISSHQKAQII